MSRDIDLIYDELVAGERLKEGTKYERLAAIVFREVSGQTTVHDLRLRGESGVRHQIDAVVGDELQRIVIETKNYDKVVDLPVVRNFWGAVEDIGPDDAFIVTTKGFSANAKQYAVAKGIRLAILRPPRDEDWEGFIRRIELEITGTGLAALPNVAWELHPDDHHKVAHGPDAGRMTETATLKLADEAGELHDFLPLLEEQLHEEYGKVQLGGSKVIGRINKLDEPTWLHLPGADPLRVTAWKWEVPVGSSTTSHVVDKGAAGLAAQLVLRTLDGSIRRMFRRDQIERWTFDGSRVAPREAS
jgi:hypothetical protein